MWQEKTAENLGGRKNRRKKQALPRGQRPFGNDAFKNAIMQSAAAMPRLLTRSRIYAASHAPRRDRR